MLLFQHQNKGKPKFTSCNVQVYNVRIPVQLQLVLRTGSLSLHWRIMALMVRCLLQNPRVVFVATSFWDVRLEHGSHGA